MLRRASPLVHYVLRLQRCGRKVEQVRCRTSAMVKPPLVLLKMLEKSQEENSKLWKKMDEEKTKLSQQLLAQSNKATKLGEQLKAANLALLKTRGRLEPRTAIDYCELNKFPSLKIQVDRHNRHLAWQILWHHPDFQEYKNVAEEDSSIPYFADKGLKFGKIVSSIYQVQNSTAHVMSGESIALPSSFTRDQRSVMRSICNYIPVDYEEEKV